MRTEQGREVKDRGGNVPLEGSTKGIDSGFFMLHIILASALLPLHWNILSGFHKFQCQLAEPFQLPPCPFSELQLNFPKEVGDIGLSMAESFEVMRG